MSSQEDTYSIINDRTGEVVPVDMFIERIPKAYWERSYARVLAEYIGVAGNARLDAAGSRGLWCCW